MISAMEPHRSLSPCGKGFVVEFAPVRRGLLSPEVLTWKVLTSAIMTRNLQMERLNAHTRLVEDDLKMTYLCCEVVWWSFCRDKHPDCPVGYTQFRSFHRWKSSFCSGRHGWEIPDKWVITSSINEWFPKPHCLLPPNFPAIQGWFLSEMLWVYVNSRSWEGRFDIAFAGETEDSLRSQFNPHLCCGLSACFCGRKRILFGHFTHGGFLSQGDPQMFSFFFHYKQSSYCSTPFVRNLHSYYLLWLAHMISWYIIYHIIYISIMFSYIIYIYICIL